MTTVTYDNKVVASIPQGHTATLPTANKTMKTDIAVTVPVAENTTDSALPIEVSTEEEMTALLTSGEIGGIYKYIGPTTGTYKNGGLYILEAQDKAVDEAGLYDANDNLIASWDELTTTYGMDCETNYTVDNYATAETSPYCVLAKTGALKDGKKLILGNAVTYIGDYAFSYCSSLTSVIIPEGVTHIGNNTFRNCAGLAYITLSSTVTEIGSHAFYNTAYYNDATNWENSVLYIGKHLLTTKDNVSGTCAIKEGTTCIAGDAFYSSSFSSVTIPDSVMYINSSAFAWCSSLTSITIPDSVTSIGYAAFWSCTSLTTIYCEADSKPDGWNDGWNSSSAEVVWGYKASNT